MATQNQIEANRRNAQNSTGPTSPEGKATSSMNALKTGIDAKCELLRFEIPQEHAALVAEYYDRFQPATPEERFLVDRMISSEWLHRRYSAVEGGVWERECGIMNKPALAGAYVRSSEQLARIDRRLNSAQRNFDKAHKELRAIQANRPAQQHQSDQPTAETAGATEVVATEQVNPELGSFLISVSERPNQQPIVEISPCAPPKTENPEPDIPLAA